MTYTALAVLAGLAVVAFDRWGVRTRLTNGWLTGRGIVRYDPDAIIGGAGAHLVGGGRLVYAPVEDLVFGFALVLLTCSLWVRLGHHRERVEK